jgi:hypothetical protein
VGYLTKSPEASLWITVLIELEHAVVLIGNLA